MVQKIKKLIIVNTAKQMLFALITFAAGKGKNRNAERMLPAGNKRINRSG